MVAGRLPVGNEVLEIAAELRTDLLGRPTLYRPAQGVADGAPEQAAVDLLEQQGVLDSGVDHDATAPYRTRCVPSSGYSVQEFS